MSSSPALNLYFSPMACSLATRIALYEAGAADATYTNVDTKAKRTLDGDDYWQVAPMGQVPVLRMADGQLLTENTAVLQYVAEHYPDARLMPQEPSQRAKLRQWLGFIGTELHKALFVPLLDPKASPDVKAYAADKAALRLGLLQKHFAQDGQDYLLDSFSVADAYLATILNWAPYAKLDLAPWPAVQAYHRRISQRPQVARALAEEFALYKEEVARQKIARV
jgi:glutathione S-transferase